MSNYNSILVAIDLEANNDAVLSKAQEFVAEGSADVHFAYVCHEPNPIYTASVGTAMIINDRICTDNNVIRDSLIPELQALLKDKKIERTNTHIQFGRPTDELITLAKELESDLIIVGSHGKHGIQLLLGSTANGVIHHAPCDVLAVRVKK